MVILFQKEIITPSEVLNPGNVFQLIKYPEFNNILNENSHKLIKISEESLGLSGRMLRKIPLLAHSLFLDSNTCSLNQFFEAMCKAVNYEKSQRINFDNQH